MPPIDADDNAFADFLDQEADTMTTVDDVLTGRAPLPPCQETSQAEAGRLAAEHGIPAHNLAGDPLTVCRQHPGRAIYAVAALGADRDLCADCRDAKAAAPVSITDRPGHPADAEVTRAQIGGGVLMSCGARDFVKSDERGELRFRVGPGGKKVRKVIVKLMPDDTYAVEYGYADMRPSRLSDPTWGVWQVVEQEHGIYAENLPAVVRRLGDRETY